MFDKYSIESITKWCGMWGVGMLYANEYGIDILEIFREISLDTIELAILFTAS
jgi:hypothetical protein